MFSPAARARVWAIVDRTSVKAFARDAGVGRETVERAMAGQGLRAGSAVLLTAALEVAEARGSPPGETDAGAGAKRSARDGEVAK